MKTRSVITEDFDDIFAEQEAKIMRDLRVATFSRVIKVNTNTIDVQPVIQEKINTRDGYKYLPLPVIKDVYYLAGQTPKVGDYVVCLHLDRSLGGMNIIEDKTGMVESGGNRHNLNDCIALVVNTGNN